MKFNKKVIESGIVTAGMIAIIMTAVPTKDMTVETKQYTNEKVLLEAEQEVATKEKVQVDSVAASAAADEVDEIIEAFTPMKANSSKDAPAVSGLPEMEDKAEHQSVQAGVLAEIQIQDAQAEVQDQNSLNNQELGGASVQSEAQQPNTSAEQGLGEAQEQGKAEGQLTENGTGNQEGQPAQNGTDNSEGQLTENGTGNQEGQPAQNGTGNQEGHMAQNGTGNLEDQIVQPGQDAQPAEENAESEVSEWDSRLMPNVEEYLNIRTEASEESEVAGKLYQGAAADILERGEEWTKISSGNVEGYVKNEFCVFNEEAETLAYEQGTVYATSMTGGLRVRAEASDSEETKILDVMEEGGKLKVDTAAEAPEGWVAVACEDQTAFVSAEFVDVELELKKAISIEEEQAAIKKAQEEAAAKKAAQQKSSSGSSNSGSSRSQREAVDASYDDVTLLGALIQCEAGSESYEGQLAVGAVVMNRLRNGYAGSISGVIYQSGQFSPASSGKLERVLSNGVSGSCLQAAQEAIAGADNVGGATSFRSASSGIDGIVIGNHVFF